LKKIISIEKYQSNLLSADSAGDQASINDLMCDEIPAFIQYPLPIIPLFPNPPIPQFFCKLIIITPFHCIPSITLLSSISFLPSDAPIF
jgi:hypothetical protein